MIHVIHIINMKDILQCMNASLGPSTECITGGPLQPLSMESAVHTNVFIDLKFRCPGLITAWRFYAAKNGTMNASVWRLEHDPEFRLIGYNEVVSIGPGLQVNSD